MRNLSLLSATAAALVLLGAGCAARPGAPTAAVAPGADLVAVARQRFTSAQIAFTEKSEAASAQKMKTAASIADAMKFKFSAGQGSVALLIVTVKDAAQAAAVKAEIESQYATLKSISATTQIEWLSGDATHLTVMNYKTGDEASAQAVKAAFAGNAAPAPAPAAAPAQPAPLFAAGDKIVADWKNGNRWWEATVTSVAGDTISLKYDDNSTDVLNKSLVAHIPKGPATVKVGDKVVARWNGGSFYAGTVVSIGSSSAKVAWSDGSSPSDVPLAEITFAGK